MGKTCLIQRVSGASSFVCTGWGTYPGAGCRSALQEQAPSCVPAFKRLTSYHEVKMNKRFGQSPSSVTMGFFTQMKGSARNVCSFFNVH